MFSPELPRQVGEARAEWKILRELAAAVDAERGRSASAATAGPRYATRSPGVIPFYDGIENLRKHGDAFQIRRPAPVRGLELPDAGRQGALPRRRRCPSPPADDGSFELSTRRGKQFNSMIYAEIDPITGAARDAVFMNPDDAAALHLRGGDRIVLVSDQGRYQGRVFPAAIAPGNLQVHWPEGNVLIETGPVDSLGGVPDYNARVRVEKS